MYKVNSYLINSFNDSCVIQTGTSTTVVQNQQLVEFLFYIENKKIKSLTDSDLEREFSDSKDIVVEFLLGNDILKMVKEPFFKYDKVWVISNDDIFNNLFNKFGNSVMPNIEILEDDDFSKIKSNDMIVLFFNPFHLEKYINLMDSIKEKEAIIKTVFYYNHSIYVSNYYKKDWRNPCPKCFFYSLETQLRGTLSSNELNFQTIIDIIYEQNGLFNIEAELETIDYLKPIDILLSDIKFNKNPNQFVNKVYEISISKGTINQDYAYHWELCDCYD